jgi:CTP:molybdopterin cytidylyltransferase MocA
MSAVAGIVLAAGGSSRFGSPKQLAPFRGRPLIEWPLRAVREAGLEPIVVLGAHAPRIAREADLGGARVVVCDGWATGQSASLRAGIEAAREAGATAAVVVLGDQPLIAREAIRRVVAAAAAAAGPVVARARYDDGPGHPTLLPAAIWERVDALRGDAGARALLADVEVVEVACHGLGSPADADTPEALRELAG